MKTRCRFLGGCSLVAFSCIFFASMVSAGGDASVDGGNAKVKLSLNTMQSFMLESLAGSPYFALVEHTSYDIVELDGHSNSASFEQKVIYHANPIRVFRGVDSEKISYFAIVEKGEHVAISPEPKLISLCHSDEGYYWPGVGSSFPSTKENIELITEAVSDLPKVQKVYSMCD